MPGAGLQKPVRTYAAEPVVFEARVIWKNVGQPEDGYLLSIGKEHGFQAGDRVKVTIERIKE